MDKARWFVVGLFVGELLFAGVTKAVCDIATPTIDDRVEVLEKRVSALEVRFGVPYYGPEPHIPYGDTWIIPHVYVNPCEEAGR